jgi:hypothetical protein
MAGRGAGISVVERRLWIRGDGGTPRGGTGHVRVCR